LLPAADAIAYMPFVQPGVFGGPHMTPCCGWIMTAPPTATGLAGDTHRVTVADGLNT
jgi:hypothetical protein